MNLSLKNKRYKKNQSLLRRIKYKWIKRAIKNKNPAPVANSMEILLNLRTQSGFVLGSTKARKRKRVSYKNLKLHLRCPNLTIHHPETGSQRY